MSENSNNATPAEQDEARGDAGLFAPRSFAILLGVLTLASYGELLTGSRSLFQRDFLLFGYPLAQYHKASLLAGELPLWNPLSHCGIPFLAQWNTMTLYPGALLYLLLPLPWSLNLFVVLHAYAAGLGMYFLARRLSGSDPGAAVAGLGYCFGGLLQESLLWPNNMAAFGWLPWVLLALDRGVREGGRPLAVAALVGATQMLCGAPEVILATWILGGALILFVDAEGRFDFCWIRLRRFALAAMWVAALAAAQLFPFLELLGHASRVAGEGTVHWSASSRVWVNLFVPAFDTVAGAHGAWYQAAQGWTRSVYPGLAVLMVSAAVICRRPDARVWLLALGSVLAVALASGENGVLYPALRRVLPLEVMRYPVKFLILLSPALPLLAAFGMRSIVADQQRRTLRPLLLATLLALFAFVVAMQVDRQAVEIRWSLVRQGLMWALLAAPLCWGIGRRGAFTNVTLAAVLFAQWVDLRWHLPGMVQSVDSEALELVIPEDRRLPAPKAEDFYRVGLSHLARNALAFRHWPDPAEDVVMRRLHLAENLNLVEGIAKVGGFFSLWPFEQEEYMARLYSDEDAIRDAMADFPGIRYWKNFRGGLQWRYRPTAMALVTAGQAVEFADGHELLDRLMNGAVDPRRTVLLPTKLKGKLMVAATPEAEVADLSVRPHEIRFRVKSPGECAVVIAQCHYPRWRAWVGGRRVEIHRANHAFQAIIAPAGEHEVVLKYVDVPFWAGVMVSGLALIVAGFFWRDSNGDGTKGREART